MEEVIKVDFLTNLDFLLKENKITRADLAREIGISPSTINVWYHRGFKNYHNLDPKEKNILLKRIVKRIEYTKLDNNLNINIDLLM